MAPDPVLYDEPDGPEVERIDLYRIMQEAEEEARLFAGL